MSAPESPARRHGPVPLHEALHLFKRRLVLETLASHGQSQSGRRRADDRADVVAAVDPWARHHGGAERPPRAPSVLSVLPQAIL